MPANLRRRRILAPEQARLPELAGHARCEAEDTAGTSTITPWPRTYRSNSSASGEDMSASDDEIREARNTDSLWDEDLWTSVDQTPMVPPFNCPSD